MAAEVAMMDREVRLGRFVTVDPVAAAALDRLTRLARAPIPLHLEAADSTTRAALAEAAHRELHPARADRAEPVGEPVGEPLREVDGGRLTVEDCLAAGGTTFVDDLAQVALELQVRLAREIGRHPARCRWVTGSARSLEEERKAGRIRAELAAVLLPGRVTIPPLSARPADVQRMAREVLGERVDGELAEVLARHRWPGGEAELRAVLHAVEALGGEVPPHLLAARSWTDDPEDTQRAEVEARRIARAIASADGNLAKAAETLGVSRSTLWRRRRRLGV
jgi:hypothetical protein